MTQNPKIYRIDMEHRLLKNFPTSELVIQKILNTSFSKLGIKSTFESKNLNTIKKDDLIYYLYLYNSDEIVSDWKEFLPKDLSANRIFKQQKLSLILFIESEFNLFCVIGGNAYQIILPFIDQSFGLNIYARIINANSSDIDHPISI